jgi:maleamate amidohydrolase
MTREDHTSTQEDHTSAGWRAAIPAEEWELYEAAAFGRPTGMGTRPAVLVIDVQYRTVGDEPAPIRESMRRWYRTSCGQAGWDVVGRLGPLLEAARANGTPVVYPHVAVKSAADAGRTGTKIPSLMAVDRHGYEFVEQVAPRPGDLLIPKRHPSAFFGTALVSYLIDLGVDTVILTGCTTSGCVRATASDAFAYNFRCVVVEDCVYDRSVTSHNVNLFDIQAKYGDVVPSPEVITSLGALGAAGVAV